MARFKSLILTELGETTDTYDYHLDFLDSEEPGLAKYKFKTPNHSYTVFFKTELEILKVQFETDQTRTAATNEGNQFRVTATVLEIAKEVWKNREELFDSYLAKIKFDAAYRDEEYGQDTNAREKLYKRFIRKQFPNAKVDDSGEETIIIPAQID